MIKTQQNGLYLYSTPHPCHATLLPCKLCIIHHGMIVCLSHFIHMLVHFIYVGPCLFGSSSNRRWAGDIPREPGALPRSFSRFNWAARQALPHACIHIVPIASILFSHHWVAIALNWISSIAQPLLLNPTEACSSIPWAITTGVVWAMRVIEQHV